MKNSLVCFLPYFYDNSGHEVSFIKLLKKISFKLKKGFLVILPKKNILNFNLKNHKKIIFSLKNKDLKFLYNLFKNFLVISNLLKKNNFNKKDIVYLDGYNLVFLIIFTLAFLINKQRNFFVIYSRYNLEGFSGFICLYCFKIIKNISHKVILLTDTDKLKKNLTTFKIKSILMPIPHTFKRSKIVKKKLNPLNIKILFPGKFRKDKFSKNFHNFLITNNSKDIEINISNKFSYYDNYKYKFKRFTENLSRQKYLNLFKETNFIILPYNDKLYKYRSSGIFIEAISLKKITFVSKATWMADELQKFKLGCLVVKDWSSFKLSNSLKIYDDPEIKKKIDIMHKKYLSFHNEKNFISVFKTIIN